MKDRPQQDLSYFWFFSVSNRSKECFQILKRIRVLRSGWFSLTYYFLCSKRELLFNYMLFCFCHLLCLCFICCCTEGVITALNDGGGGFVVWRMLVASKPTKYDILVYFRDHLSSVYFCLGPLGVGAEGDRPCLV